MEKVDIFKQSRALKNISTNTKTYVREVAEILRLVIDPTGKEHPWRCFEYEKAGVVTRCEYETFNEYLGQWSRLTLKQLKDLFHADAAILDLLDVATQRKAGGDTSIVNNINDAKRPEGDTVAAGLRRLRKDRPDLHQLVLQGGISTHGAMLQAGFRRPTKTIPIDTPASAVRALLRVFSAEEIIDAAQRESA